MKAVHRICEGCSTISKSGDTGPGGFCLGDLDGGYLWLDTAPASRYQGWFVRRGETLLKTVENIELIGADPVSAVINNFWNVKRVRGAVTEEFFIPSARHALVYKVSRPSGIALTLDIKKTFENIELGRHYDITPDGNRALVRFYRDNDPESEFFLAVVSDSSLSHICREWVERDHPYDRKRGSKPFERWVFRALTFQNASIIVVAASGNRQEAQKEADLVFNDLAKLRSKRRGEHMDTVALFKNNFGIDHARGLHANSELAAGGVCGINALRSLVVPQGDLKCLSAGFPWFFQFWQRDQAISLAGLSLAMPSAVLPVFLNLIRRLEEGFEDAAPDGVGWIFFAARDLVIKHLLSAHELRRVSVLLEKIVTYLLKNQTIGGFAVNDPGTTWMDSLGREGARIETQALRLNLYGLASMISVNASKRAFYRSLEIDLLLETRKKFMAGDILADGCDPAAGTLDATVRPNIFLAAYAYPGLLEKSRWQKCFDAALAKLWLDWGGLSTIDINDAQFHAAHSGENPASYHNGDSWFYINNIAALVMHRLNPIRYNPYVRKILAAGVRNVLWGQVPGFSSELSSARVFEPSGCFNQAWSDATFLALFQVIGAKHFDAADFGP